MWIQIAQVIVMFVVLVTAQQALPYVLATVISVLVLVQYITVQQVMLSVLIQLPHLPVLVVAQHLIVLLVLTLMVHVELQLAAVMFVGMILWQMELNAQLVSSVVVAPVLMSLMALLVMGAQPLIIDVMEEVIVLPQPPARTWDALLTWGQERIYAPLGAVGI